MPKRLSKIANSLKELGDIQVTEWDFMSLLNTEISELEISRSLRRLGQTKVIEWDFRTVLPAVKKTANQEVDVIGFFKRAASYKVLEWDFKSPPMPAEGPAELQEVILRLKNFLHYVVVNLIDEPDHAQIKVEEMEPTGLRFRLVMVKRDVATLIGREGQTASAIRGIFKSAAAAHGVQVLLQIHSHEEEVALLEKEGR
jgi:uncharacterized protein